MTEWSWKKIEKINETNKTQFFEKKINKTDKKQKAYKGEKICKLNCITIKKFCSVKDC